MAVLIDPWGSILIEDIERLVKEFGLERMTSELREGVNHYLFERNLVLAHRDFKKILDCREGNKPFINVTAIASSGKLHFGHKIIVDIFKLFSSFRGSKNYFGIADLDGFVSREKTASMNDAREFAVENLAHVMALGIKKEHVYIQSKKEPRYYELAFELSKKLTENMLKATYGHLDIGKVAANLLQYADILHPQLKEFEGKMPSITSIGIDQDPHARIARDLAKRSGYLMDVPSFIFMKYQSGLVLGKKMSSSEPDTTIFLSDSSEEIERKMKKAFSGGRDSVDEHRRLGGNPDIDRAYELLLFHHPDSRLVQQVYEDYKSGKMLSGELKKICTEFLCKMLTEHQRKARAARKVAEKMVLGE